jgi:hypothetical protein
MHRDYVPLASSRNQMDSHSQHHPQVSNRHDMGYMTTAEDQDNDEDFIGFPHKILVDHRLHIQKRPKHSHLQSEAKFYAVCK